MWSDLLAALALLLILEGVVPFLNPAALRRAMQALGSFNDSALRFIGLTSMVAGVLLLYFVR